MLVLGYSVLDESESDPVSQGLLARKGQPSAKRATLDLVNSQQAKAPELVIRTPDGKSQTIALDRPRLSLGRSSANEICFADDAGLSRHHLTIEHSSDGWYVRDLGSKNGTTLNGKAVSGAIRLSLNDRVNAGNLVIEFHDASAAPAQTVVFVDTAVSEDPTTTVIADLQAALGEGDPNKTRAFQGTPQMRALIRAGRELADRRPLNELFEVIMDLSMEAVGASRGVLMTLDGNDLQARAARGGGFQISTTVRDRVLQERASLLVRDAQADLAFKAQMSIVQQRVRSMLAVPLQTKDRVIGLIYLDSPNFIRDFTREDLNLLTVMANVAAIRIEHARLVEIEQEERLLAQELGQAALIQRRLLPSHAPAVMGLDVAGHNSACRTVGGDYYDFIAYPDGRILIVVGDVAGKGMPAAIMMSSLQARVQVLFEDPEALAAKISRLNRTIAVNCPDNRFITFFAAVIAASEPAGARAVHYCNAGHNPPLLVRADGSVETLTVGGIILGILGTAKYQEGVCEMCEGDILVLFSDGVTEASNPESGEEFGEDRLARLVYLNRMHPASTIIDAVKNAVAAWSAGSPQADDITVVIAKADMMATTARNRLCP